MIDATLSGHYEVVKLLIEHGADVNARKGTYNTVEIPLMYAVQYERFDIAKLLIDNGADVNTKDNDGKTPLMIATQSGLTNV